MNLWDKLKEHTEARIGLHRQGHSISTKELLEFQLAHALARDAVIAPWDIEATERAFWSLDEKPILLETSVSHREQYLKFPNLGRELSIHSKATLQKEVSVDIVFIVTDGLSSHAIDTHLIPFWKVLKPAIISAFPKLKTALVFVPFGRVALSDEIGEILKAKLSIIIVGERPGLTSVDSLGIYLTYGPKKGNTDANRNCISNIHPPGGVPLPSCYR